MQLEKSLNDKFMQLVDRAMVTSLRDIFESVAVLWMIGVPAFAFGDVKFDFEGDHITESASVLLSCVPSLGFKFASG